MAFAVIGEAPVDTAEPENLSMRGNSIVRIRTRSVAGARFW